MLPAAHRMRRGQDFDAAVRRGRRVGRRTLVIHGVAGARSDDGPDPVRIGFVVSRAVGSSVIRSRVKRRLRAVMSQRLDQLPSGWLLVVRANAASSEASSAELAGDLDVALARLLRTTSAGVPERTGG